MRFFMVRISQGFSPIINIYENLVQECRRLTWPC